MARAAFAVAALALALWCGAAFVLAAQPRGTGEGAAEGGAAPPPTSSTDEQPPPAPQLMLTEEGTCAQRYDMACDGLPASERSACLAKAAAGARSCPDGPSDGDHPLPEQIPVPKRGWCVENPGAACDALPAYGRSECYAAAAESAKTCSAGPSAGDRPLPQQLRGLWKTIAMSPAGDPMPLLCPELWLSLCPSGDPENTTFAAWDGAGALQHRFPSGCLRLLLDDVQHFTLDAVATADAAADASSPRREGERPAEQWLWVIRFDDPLLVVGLAPSAGPWRFLVLRRQLGDLDDLERALTRMKKIHQLESPPNWKLLFLAVYVCPEEAGRHSFSKMLSAADLAKVADSIFIPK